VAWARTANHAAGQAPDDAYLSAPISNTVLQNIISGAACGYTSDGNGCAMRFRFKLPPMPNMPCAPGTSCPLPSGSDLRYMSLTFGYVPPGGTTSMLADIDGENPAVTGPDSYSIVSLADPAFAAAANASGYVTLIVNVNPNLIGYSGGVPVSPVGIAYHSASSGGYTVTSAPILQGAGPVQPLSNHLEGTPSQRHYYTAWVNSFSGGSADPYIVLDLTQFGDFWDTASNDDTNAACTKNSGTVLCNSPLILTLRSTMLGNDFACSAFSVPYNTAEYTNYASSDGYSGGGFMGPYVPMVDYIAVGALTESAQTGCGTPGHAACPDALPPPPALQAGDLPSQESCGQFPVNAVSGTPIFPQNNSANSSMQALFPTQYWPNTNGGTTLPPNLNCSSGSSTFTPEIDYVGTEFTIQAMISGEPGYSSNPTTTPSPCASVDTAVGSSNSNPCMQVIKQKLQDANTYQPPLPLTIIGSGFGYLAGLPWAGTNPPYVLIQDVTANWSTNDGNVGNCQVYISDWTDTSISLLLGLPQSVENGAGTQVSPLTEMSPASFFQSAPAGTCPVAALDKINVTVTNPWSGNHEVLPNPVKASVATTTPY
jgi:hypothetical protein